ncbi:MAG: RluA family pseudouridine synthase [Fusobacteria bacterium]|nr:RluA family pseudouridine synthase [Fusobacteriota bacterium]
MEFNYIITSEHKGLRLDAFLLTMLEEQNFTKSYIQTLVKNHLVTVNGEPTKNGLSVKEGMKILVSIPKPLNLDVLPENIPLDIVYQDKDILIINKSAGIMVHPAQDIVTGTIVNAIMYHITDLSDINGVVRPGIVHRLDKDTTGLLIVAKNNPAHLAITKLFQEHKIKKTYLCICKGYLKKKEGSLYTKMGRDSNDRKKMAVTALGKEAITHYKMLAEGNNMSLLDVKIDTGRTHQIRVHLRYLNTPVLGDAVYGKEHDRFKRQLLHAYSLAFNHPITGEPLKFKAPLPEDFQTAIKHYGFTQVEL